MTVGLALLLTTVMTNRFSQFLGIKKEFGGGLSPSVSSDALAFARDVGITGRPFNCLIQGGLMAWQLFPEQQVFVDGRLEAYPETHFETYFRVLDVPETWPELAARYDFDYALLYTGAVDRYGLARYLAAGHGWELVYHDETAALFLPVDERHRAVRERAEQAFARIQARRLAEPLPPAPGALRRLLAVPLEELKLQTAYGDFLRFLAQYPEAVRAYRRALVLAPDDPDVRLSLGGAYWYGGNHDQAVHEWREILRLDPGFELARRALAEATKSGEQGVPPPR